MKKITKDEKKKRYFTSVREFKDYLGDRALSDNTISAYDTDIKMYVDFLIDYEKISDEEDIEREHIVRYIDSLKRKKMSKKTIARKIIAIKEYHKFLFDERITRDNVALNIDAPKTDKKIPTVLTQEEIIKMIESINGKDPLDLRNRAMLEVMYSSGLRVSELLNLKLDELHIKADEKYLMINNGKGNKQRVTPLGDLAATALNKYLRDGRPKLFDGKSTYLFFNYKGEPMSRQGFFKFIKKLASDNGIEKEISPHTIRHSFATHILQGGTDIRVLQHMLGHEDISTTQIYTHIDISKIKDDYDNAHPLSKNKHKED